MKLLRNIWTRYSLMDADSAATPAEKRQILFINKTWLLTTFMVCVTGIILPFIYGLLLWLDRDFYASYYKSGLIAVLSIPFYIIFYHYRFRASVRLAGLHLMQIFILLLAAFYGSEYRFELIMLSLFFMPFAFTAEQKGLRIYVQATNFLTVMGLLAIYNMLPPLFPIRHKIAYHVIQIFTVSFASSTAIAVSWYLIRDSDEAEEKISREMKKSEKLLLNILPAKIAGELKENGITRPERHPEVTVLFTDFVGFTGRAEKMSAEELVDELDYCFSSFDVICEKYGLEKLKTIGDAYMCVSGIPEPDSAHAESCAAAAIEMLNFVLEYAEKRKQAGKPAWDIRIGLHSGPVVAGVIGQKKFSFDIWGDTVNTASRMESSGESGRINVSEATAALLRGKYRLLPREKIEVKGKGGMNMFFLEPQTG